MVEPTLVCTKRFKRSVAWFDTINDDIFLYNRSGPTAAALATSRKTITKKQNVFSTEQTDHSALCTKVNAKTSWRENKSIYLKFLICRGQKAAASSDGSELNVNDYDVVGSRTFSSVT